MNKYELISYANSFVSFLLRDEVLAKNLNQVIIFGSVPRGDFTKESDIDLFIDLKTVNTSLKKRIEGRKRLFMKSKVAENWRTRGLINDVRLKIGLLKEWPGLQRSIITDGLILYGKYMEVPKGLRHNAFIKLDLRKRKRSENVKLWRKLYGYKQRVGKKTYVSRGLIKELGGRRIGRSIVMIPINGLPDLTNFLKKSKVKHEILEAWSED